MNLAIMSFVGPGLAPLTAFALVRTLVAGPVDALGVWRMLALGVAVGTPMSVPAVVTTRKAVLRHLDAVGFIRVEGTHASREWWTHV
ncbi:MAG: hypothetical protein L7U50_06035 [Candidatus Nanopelagicales bacterium]|jgi:hypothetical protein|nr:hypothetical protein [Candidatus Nanopelagicales bacterium]MCH1570760.1 hypothetical protein [Longimicrobiales bacterium]